MKKILALVLVLSLLCAFFVGCGETGEEKDPVDDGKENVADDPVGGGDDTPAGKTIKVGLICIGDENDQGYTYNFIRGKEAATEALKAEGVNVEWLVKWNIGEDSACEDANIELAEAGCDLIINNSFGHEDYMLKVAPNYPDIEFVSCTNQVSWGDDLENTHNAFANIYEGRYVAGVVAGMKLQEMIEKGEITAEEAVIGYVGAFSFAEVISGFTSYYLGARSVCPSVTMKVQFVGSWSDATAEATAADALCDAGCVLISQHSDNSTPATTAQSKGAYHTGYNNDMIGVAPDASLTGTRIDWSVYFTEIIRAVSKGESFAQDWSGGFAEGAVVMTGLNEAICAPGTAEKVAEVEEAIKNGTIKVFDTTTFTIGGAPLTAAFALDTDGDFTPDSEEAVFDGCFNESYFQSAPYFALQIDGIEWLNSAF